MNKDGSVLIPEIIVFNTLTNVLKIISEDFKTKTDKKKTIIYRIFGDLKMINFNLFEVCGELFTDKQGGGLAVTLGYNVERIAIPTIHITIPSESVYQNGIGNDEGYNEVLEEDYDFDAKSYNGNINKAFNCNYQLVLTSLSYNHVLIMYNLLKHTLLSLTDHFSHCGLYELKLSGQELVFYSEIIPSNVFHRNISLEFWYESKIYNFLATKFGSSIEFSEQLIN
jgi:hypothetical protein